MLDLSGYEMEHCNTLNCTVAKDKYGINIGISEDNMKCNMFHDDVKCLRDIYGVGASTVSLIEEWIKTGSMKRLENLRNEVDDTIREKVHYSLTFEDGKKDYTIDFVEALGKLADLYEEEEDHRATAFRRAIIALELKSIHSVEDIETQKLIDLKGVGKSTLEMFKEFIETGKIEKLEEMRPEEFVVDGDDNFPTLVPELKKLSQIDIKFKEKTLKMGDTVVTLTAKCHKLPKLIDIYETWDDLEKVKEDMKSNESAQQKDIVWKGSTSDGKNFTLTYHADHDGDVELEGDEDLDEGLEEFLVEELKIGEESDSEEEEPETVTPDYLMRFFGDLTEQQCDYIYDWWMECGRYTEFDPT